MKHIILYLLLFFPFQSIANNDFYEKIYTLGEKIVKDTPNQSTLAVIELLDLDGNSNHLGKWIVEELIISIQDMKGKEMKVLERQLLMNVLNEQKMSVSDLSDPSAIKNIGKLSGASQIVTGTLTEFGDEVRVNARVISTKTGEVLSVAQASIPMTRAIKDLIAKKSKNRIINEDDDKKENDDIFKQQWKGFSFKLSSCSKLSAKIVCHMVIKSEKKDTTLNIHHDTALFDNNGNKELIKNVQHGSNFDHTMKSYSYLSKEFIAGIPVKSTITFNLADKQASQVASLKLKFAKPSGEVIFRDIPL